MSSYNLGGHSGCSIYLIEDGDGRVYVRKTSKDASYNERLILQCSKQSKFTGGIVRTPAVYGSGYTSSGLFYFDMEYIQGITLSEYIRSMEIGKISALVNSIVESIVPIHFESITSEQKCETNEIFNNKISDLKSQLSGSNSTVSAAITLLEQHDWGYFIPSDCHGDMTLENIIVKDDKLYFIDFLDSFYDSWFMDIGTLLQDVQVMWSYRFEQRIDMNTVLRLIVFKDLLIDKIKSINPVYVIEIYYSLLQKLIRILPYTEDEYTNSFLIKKIQLVLDCINDLETNGGA